MKPLVRDPDAGGLPPDERESVRLDAITEQHKIRLGRDQQLLAIRQQAFGALCAGGRAQGRWLPVAKLLSGTGTLAFDHRQILGDGVERARSKIEYSPLVAVFCGEEFTITDLRRVYEVVWDVTLDPRNFHRKITNTHGFVEPTVRTTTRDGGRPAQLYRQGLSTLPHPAMLRPG
jgi:ADP-ribose pyrophosphatase YjhB (NUDIX family)